MDNQTIDINFPEKHFRIRKIFLHSWHPYVWLALVSSLLYLQIFTFSEYTQYDDYFLIVKNFSRIDELSDVIPAFFEDVSHQAQGGNLYRPILTISFILSAQISGTAPFGYHLIDIILHCTSCCLLFVTLQTIGFKRLASFIGTLLFCIHPALTQAVAWISGRNDPLLAIFILSSLLTYTKFLSTPLLRWYLLHILFFTLAVFTKETAIVFPFLALLYSTSIKGKRIFSLTTLLFLIGWGIVIFNWDILRYAARIAPVGNKLQAITIVLSNLWITLSYLGNIFWPFNLAFGPIPKDIHITAGIISAGLLFLALFLAERKDWKLIFFGVMWFIAFLIPSFYYHIEVPIPPKFYEHRIYVPCIGIMFGFLSLSFANRVRAFKQFFPILLVLIICTLGWLSYTHSFNFSNSLALLEYDSATSPNDLRRYNAITRMNIPKKLDQEINAIQGKSRLPDSNRITVSKEELWQILDSLRNELSSSHNDSELPHALAVAYFARGFYLKAEEKFLAAIHGNPRNATIHYNLGILYYSAHVEKKAEEAWQEALRLEPTMGNAHLNLSYLYYELSQYNLAWDHCQKAALFGARAPSNLVREIQQKKIDQNNP